MDDATREAIDSLITPKRSPLRGPRDTPRPEYVTRDEAMERSRETVRTTFDTDYATLAGRSTPPPPSKPTHCYNEAEARINLKDQIATLSVDTSSASIVFKGPLTDALIKRIENAVPLTQREWLPDKRVWRFSPACINILKPILKDEYKDITMLGVPKALPSTKFDQLMSKLTKDDKALVYRLLASKYHPDKGGSHEVMTLINIVFRSTP